MIVFVVLIVYQCFLSPSLLLCCVAATDLWESTGQEVASALRAMGLPVTMEPGSKGRAREALNEIREADKVKGQS